MRLRPGHHELGRGEGASLLGQPFGAKHVLGEGDQLGRARLAVGRAVKEPLELLLAEVVLGGAGAPLLCESREVELLLPLAARHRRHLGGVEAGCGLLGHVLDDLRPPGREGVDDGSGDALELGPALVRLLPLDSEPGGEPEA